MRSHDQTLLAGLHARAVACLIGLGLVLPMVVVWSVHYVAQHDAYNHLARHYLEYLHLLGRPLPPGFEVHWRILPNLGGDFIIPFLVGAFGAEGGLKLFLCAALAFHWGGAAVFILQEGEHRPAAWVASLFFLPLVLSSTFNWGFLNYYTGIGLAFLAAAHLRALDRRTWPRPSALVLHAALLALLFLWHLGAVVVYGVLLGCVAFMRLLRDLELRRLPARSLARVGVLFLPLMPAFILFMLYSSGQSGSVALSWEGPVRKATMLFSVVRGYDLRADAVVALSLAAAWLLFFARSVRNARFTLAACASIAFLIAYVVLPAQWRSTWGADMRMLPPLVVCVLAWSGTLPIRWSWVGMALLGTAILARSGDEFRAWQRLDARLRDAAASFAHIAPGASVLPISLVQAVSKEDPETHFASLAVITRQAYVPGLFAFPEQQPIRLVGETRLAGSDPALRPAGRVENGVFELDDPRAAEAYDYLWIYNPTAAELRLSPVWSRVFAGERVSLWARQVR